MIQKSEDLHNNLIVLYIIIVVILTVFATWVVLTKAMPATVQNGGTSATVGLTVIEPDAQPIIKNLKSTLDNFGGKNEA